MLNKTCIFNDMRDFLNLLDEHGQLRQVDIRLRAQRGDNELQELMRHLAEIDGPALILNNLDGYNMPEIPVIFNPFGTRERTAMVLGETDPLEAKKKHANILADRSSWHAPVTINAAEAPCKEVIIPGDEISLDKHLPAVWFGKEGASYICGGVVVSKDPETGERNVGWYRLTQFWDAEHPTGGSYSEERQKKQLAIFAFWNPPMSHIGLHVAKAKRLGKPLEIAVAFLCDPVIHLAACTGVPFGHDEFSFAGGLRGAPVELVQCETVDLEVPATAEFVIECVIEPDTVEETIGWHSNSVGYYDKVQFIPVIDVKCITRRQNPYWYATMEMMPPFDHNYIGLLPVEGEVLADLQRKIPEVKDVVVTPNMTYVIQLSVDGVQKPHPYFGKFVLHAVWGAQGRWGRVAKIVIVVGPDVDPYDLTSVEWAIQTRVQPYSDTIINQSAQAMILDPSAPKSAHGFALSSEQIGFDALIKVPERFDDYAEVSQADPEKVRKIAEKMKAILS
ncbi:MAG TPA: UbiD family decarboxylase [Gammaproteobacteria bacterium]|nr:UbiD family decarboxylase [Gammaproteobacteria bacterium]MDP7297613.1 UbiD family decarboxylase [Gammaproteobacteria bacterium]HJP39311.1 UbiD family decarboxylase [Gammaproteobacteria bacterium]